MSYIPALLASIDARLENLTAEIEKLETARTALERSSLSAAPVVPRNGSTRSRSRRTAPRRAAQPVSPETASVDSAPVEPAAGAQKARRSRAGRAQGSRRPVAQLRPEELERVLSTAETGLSASAIAEHAGVRYEATLRLLRELEASGQVRREGSRRSTVWRLISDEERIAERAAELELRSASRR